MKQQWIFFVPFVLLFAFIFLVPTLMQTHKNTTHTIYRTTAIVFVPGLGLTAKDYQSLLTKLQNDRYQVIVYTPIDTNVSNYQELVKVWTKGISKEIGNRKVIVIGHSVGGAVATYFCSIDKHCIAGINMDGSPAFTNKISVPFLYIQADTGTYCDQQCMQGRALMEKLSSQPKGIMIHISGIKHYNFTDLRTKDLEKQDYLGTIDGRDFIYANIHAFLAEQKN